MQFFQGYLYALRLKPQKAALLRRWVGCRRWVWNEALAFQRAELEAGRGRPTYAELSARLPGLKREHPWLADPPAQALQQALKDLCKAWDAKYSARFGAPRFKRRDEGDTLRLPQACRYDSKAGTLFLPKLGAVRLRHSREAIGELKSVTLRLDRGRCVAALQTAREIVPAPVATAATAAVGLDFGVVTTIMPSNEAMPPIKLPQRICRYERRMKRLQQAVSRKKRGSANRKKAVSRLRAIHARIVAMRRDFLHKATTDLVRTHALVAIEDLAVKSMTASAAGTVDAPGKNVRQKSGLNRSILRNGWAMARGMLEYKAAWSGVMLVAVPPAYTSQECSACSHAAPENRQSQALFSCVACGHTEHADRNAAKNILRRAQEQLGVSAGLDARPDARPARTPGHCGELMPVKPVPPSTEKMRRPRPRSAAQGASMGAPLAGTSSELSPSGKLDPNAMGTARMGGQDVKS